MSDPPQQTFGLPVACVNAARAALLPLVVDDASLQLLSLSVAQLLHEMPDGDVVMLDTTTGRVRFGRHGYPLRAADAVREFRDASARQPGDGAWMVAGMFKREDD